MPVPAYVPTDEPVPFTYTRNLIDEVVDKKPHIAALTGEIGNIIWQGAW